MKNKFIAALIIFFFLVQSSPLIAFAQNNKQLAGQLATSAHDAYSLKQYKKAAELYEKAYALDKVKIYQENSIVAHKNCIVELANNEKYDESIAYANKLLAKYPENKQLKELLSDSYYSRASEFFYNNDLEAAKNDLENSLKFAQDSYQKERAEDYLSKLKLAKTKGYSISKRTNEEKSLVTNTENYLSDNYIDEILDQSNGRVSIFGQMPIKVYFNSASVSPYKRFYEDAVKDGFKEWEKASGGIIAFEYVNAPSDADLQVEWVKNFTDYPWKPELKIEDLSNQKEKMKYRKAGKIVSIGSAIVMIAGGLCGVPVIGTVGSLGSSVASPFLMYKGSNNDKVAPDIKIDTQALENLSDEEAKLRLKQVAMHNIGHAIGICGHSANKTDIMYENFTAKSLSQRDINTIKFIYNKNKNK